MLANPLIPAKAGIQIQDADAGRTVSDLLEPTFQLAIRVPAFAGTSGGSVP